MDIPLSLILEVNCGLARVYFYTNYNEIKIIHLTSDIITIVLLKS